MKAKVVCIAIAMCFSSIGKIIAQERKLDLTEEEIRTLLCNKWRTEEIEMPGLVRKIPASQAYIFTFSKNGTVVMRQKGDNHNEIWTYNYATNTINMKENKKAKYQDNFIIEEISNTRLTLRMVSGEMAGGTMRYMRIK
jgi:hypothetical protein